MFSDNLEKDISLERRWNDYKTRGHSFVQGAFTMEEIDKLKIALCEYAREQDDPMSTLIILCSKSKEELKAAGLLKAWPLIAECLPHRSV